MFGDFKIGRHFKSGRLKAIRCDFPESSLSGIFDPVRSTLKGFFDWSPISRLGDTMEYVFRSLCNILLYVFMFVKIFVGRVKSLCLYWCLGWDHGAIFF